MMKRLLLILLIPFLTCTSEPVTIMEFDSIKNKPNWRVSLYTEDGVKKNIFDSHTFKFIDNEQPNCADWMDGKCGNYNFGGHYLINKENTALKFTILLPEICYLEYITGKWTILELDENTIYLIRILDKKQELIFKSN